MEGGAACRKGSTAVVVLRLQPGRWRLDLHHYKEAGAPDEPADVEGWRRALGAPVVFNAGQYYPDRRPMGLFVKDGVNLGTQQLPSWKGILAAGPGARILDLDHDAFGLKGSPYGRVMQTFMILDRAGKKRVRRSDWHANRTIVAADQRGRLLVVHTEGAYTLWELADWLAASDLRVRDALSMDGGFEAQLAVHLGGLDYLSFGRYHVDDRGDHSLPGLRKTLPAVISLSRSR